MVVVRFAFRPRQCLMRARKVRAWPFSRQLPRLAFLALMLLTGLSAQPASLSAWLLTRAEEIRRLTPAQAAMAYPVRIPGVVTDDVSERDFFVQDKTAGIYVDGSHASKLVDRVGDIVQSEGVTAPGKFVPVIQECKTRVVGKGRLPKTRVYSFAELADGQMDSQWVQVPGTLRSAAIEQTSWPEVTLALGVTDRKSVV